MNWIELIGTFLIECGQQILPLFSGMVHILMGAFIFYCGLKCGKDTHI